MKIKFFLLALCIYVSSCQVVDSFRGDETIKLVQSKKFGALNSYNLKMNFLLKSSNEKTYLDILSSSGDPTNLEIADFITELLNLDNEEWTVKYIDNHIFLVAFLFDKNKTTGILWEANIENNIVRCVTCDTNLMKKYNLPQDTAVSYKPHKKYKRKHKE